MHLIVLIFLLQALVGRVTHTTQLPTLTSSTDERGADHVSSASPPSSTSTHTPSKHPTSAAHVRTNQTSDQTSDQTTDQTTDQTSDQTLSLGSTAATNATVTSTINTTSPALPNDFTKNDLESNPGLVAIICIFCVVLFLLLLVVTVKCIQSPRSNFQRLEDVPMGKVTEASPFAQPPK